MNAQVKRLMVVVLIMILATMVSTTVTQFFSAEKLNQDTRNTRAIYNAQGRPRGPIIVQGTPIASSTALPSKGTNKRYQRTYTAKDGMYSQITGFYSLQGMSTGLEQTENDVFLGQAPSQLLARLSQMAKGSEQTGGAIELTIDPAVQQAAWKALGGRRGAAVALDPSTGAILAAVSSPSYDPNPLASLDQSVAAKAMKDLQADPQRPMDNRAFGGHRFSPGSSFKLITAAAMLSSGQYTPDTRVNAPTEISLPQTTKTLSNIDHESCAGGRPTLRTAFALSCNTPFAQAGMALGQDQMEAMAEAFGFNKSFTMPLAVTASVYPQKSGKDADVMAPPQLAYSAIGQYNDQATPMQMAMVAATIANGGVEMKPYLVAHELDAKLNPTSTTSPTRMGEPISQSVANQLKDMMTAVVNEGTGTTAQINNVQVAGKTGTAEVGDSGRADGWFVGFAPADDPKIAFAVAIEGDQDGIRALHGAQVAPVARQMILARLSH
ncbi:MAG: penicillin-binding protein 2 [Actinomycetaceae bacterium]|nr:penicillin-binding protein 2 [Actinomycetaceae bacterium]MDU0971103.1 penicillin-binding protein 2 [Actinomycetaceae bacterium]